MVITGLFTRSGFSAQYYGTNGGHNTITIASSAPFTATLGITGRFHGTGQPYGSSRWDVRAYNHILPPSSVSTSYLELGRMNDGSYYSEGYLSDVRITKGLARYTSNFTAPTAALQGKKCYKH